MCWVLFLFFYGGLRNLYNLNAFSQFLKLLPHGLECLYPSDKRQSHLYSARFINLTLEFLFNL